MIPIVDRPINNSSRRGTFRPKGAWFSKTVYQGQGKVMGPYYHSGVYPDPLAEQKATEEAMKVMGSFEVKWLPTIDMSRAIQFFKGNIAVNDGLEAAGHRIKRGKVTSSSEYGLTNIKVPKVTLGDIESMYT